MAGIIVADTIQSGGSFIRLNSASQTVATINASGIYANTGNLLIAANGTIGVASITNTAITGTITQAQIGNGVAGTGPAFSAYITGTVSLSSTVSTKVQFNLENYDTANCFDSSTNYRFTPNVAGYYMFIGNIYGNTNTGNLSYNVARIYKNGSPYRSQYNYIASGSVSTAVSAIIYMNGTTDYVELYAQVSGTSPYLNSSENGWVYFDGCLLRAA